MSWSRAVKEAARSGMAIERTRLEPLVALRATAGLAIAIAAFGAFMAAVATFQQSWRPRPVLALARALRDATEEGARAVRRCAPERGPVSDQRTTPRARASAHAYCC